jgi:hypothetical protein
VRSPTEFGYVIQLAEVREKRRYGLRHGRLKGHRGARTWTTWAILAYILDTLAIRTA